MFVKLESPEDASILFAELAELYTPYTDRPDLHVTFNDFDRATQTFPVIVFVENDFDGQHTLVHFPSKVLTVGEL